jgi:hypothetical protein
LKAGILCDLVLLSCIIHFIVVEIFLVANEVRLNALL